MSIPSICLIFFVCLTIAFSETTADTTLNRFNPIVLTRDGLVRGRSARTVGRQITYYGFQGIPYAEPPTGDRRFKAPVKKANWRGILDATQDGSQCVQSILPPQGSEDCLFINVYTPRLIGGRLPVMAWIYGGGFIGGNSSYRSYGPDYFLEENVVFVSFNYRLGIFGFGSTRDSAAPGNFGLKDQILALKWIQDNIASFCGDPKKVTIFGQSAGSASVSYLLQTELAKDLFRGAIMQSGTSLCLWAFGRSSRDAMFAIGEALNVDTSSSTALINGLRQVNATTLQDVSLTIAVNITLDNLLGGLVFAPVPEEGVVDRYSEEALAQGRFIRKPVMMGVTSNEAVAVGGFIAPVVEYFERYEANISGLTPVDLTRNQTKVESAAAEIRSFYFGSSDFSNQTNAVVKFVSDDFFNRAVRRTALDQSKYVPVYFYEFSYAGRLAVSANRTLEGVGHGEENAYLFRDYSNFTVSPNDKFTRSRIVKLWTNFAKYTNPTPSKDALVQDVKWLPTKSKPDDLLYLDINSDLKLKRNPFEKHMQFWDRIYNEYGDPPYDTY